MQALDCNKQETELVFGGGAQAVFGQMPRMIVKFRLRVFNGAQPTQNQFSPSVRLVVGAAAWISGQLCGARISGGSPECGRVSKERAVSRAKGILSVSESS